MLRSSWSREVVEDSKLFTKRTKFFILKFSTMITSDRTNVATVGVLQPLSKLLEDNKSITL